MDKLKVAQAMDINQETEIQWKCPYYITYEDSNKWIEAHPEYMINKQNQSNQMKVPLLSSVKGDSDDSMDVLDELSDEELA